MPPSPIPYNRQTDFVPGRVDRLSPRLRRVMAPKPGPFTFLGTQTYIVGTGTVAPSATRGSPSHWVERGGLRVLLDCGAGTMHALARFGLAWERTSHVVLTHFHPDHFGELPALLFALRHATVTRARLESCGWNAGRTARQENKCRCATGRAFRDTPR